MEVTREMEQAPVLVAMVAAVLVGTLLETTRLSFLMRYRELQILAAVAAVEDSRLENMQMRRLAAPASSLSERINKEVAA